MPTGNVYYSTRGYSENWHKWMPSGFVSILFWDSRYGAAKYPIPQDTVKYAETKSTRKLTTYSVLLSNMASTKVLSSTSQMHCVNRQLLLLYPTSWDLVLFAIFV